MRPQLFVALRAIAPVVVLCVGCASIDAFSAIPRTACAGDAVTVTWVANGDVTISAEPAVSDIGPKASSGSQRFIVDRDTRFTLKATRLLSCKTTEADVVVAPPSREYGGVAACSSAERTITLAVPLGEGQVSSALKVSSVTNVNARPMVLAKGSVRATIPARGHTAAFDREPVTGTWTLQADLAPGESCEDALRLMASRLTFRVGFGCGQ